MVKLDTYNGYTPVISNCSFPRPCITAYRFDAFTTDIGRDFRSEVGEIYRGSIYASYGILFESGSPEYKSNYHALLTKDACGNPLVFIKERYRNFKVIKALVKYLKTSENYSNKNFKYVDDHEFGHFFYKATLPARLLASPESLINQLINNESAQIQLASTTAAF